MKKNDYIGPHNSIDARNPEKKKEHDWWDELCKAHGAENHWKKDKKKLAPKRTSDDDLN